MDSQTGGIVIGAEGAVGTILLNRPERINAINDAIRLGLPEALRALDRDPAIAAILVRGAGERGFCAGADVLEQRPPETVVETRRRLSANPWLEHVAATAKPLIAAIHGICFGAGLELALACDLRIAAPGALFALPEINLGLLPGGGGTQRLPRLIGQGRALDLMLTGDRLDATEAMRIGLVTRLSSDSASLEAEAMALAQRIAAKPPSAAAFIKEAVRRGGETDLPSGLAMERSLFALLLSTEDHKEAALAFREKRKPVFSGR